jgi:hypothetical protein
MNLIMRKQERFVVVDDLMFMEDWRSLRDGESKA